MNEKPIRESKKKKGFPARMVGFMKSVRHEGAGHEGRSPDLTVHWGKIGNDARENREHSNTEIRGVEEGRL